jgi:hypothetical protein
MGIGGGTATRRAGIDTSARLNPADDEVYQQFYPYYAELCALSEIRKKPGLGVPLRSGIGGHSLLYLKGVRRDRQARYPTLELCEPDAVPTNRGVSISVNSHYMNANWIAADGPDFVWNGALEPGERLTRSSYERTQDHAKAMGVLDGVKFHEHFFRDKPPGMSERDYMYEISIATDYAVKFGRDIYRTRIPLDRQRMAAIVDFLNDLNSPYRDGSKVFNWRVLNNNCSHVAHNALAKAGIWDPWPTGQFFAFAAFKFPVPKNEFVDLVLRTNDLPVDDSQAMFDDEIARNTLLQSGKLPTAAGALVMAEEAIQENEVYDVNRLRLIFYDNPFWGPYRSRLARILGETRYSDFKTNLLYFKTLYSTALKRQRAVEANSLKSKAKEAFDVQYTNYIESEAKRVGDMLMSLDHVSSFQADNAL